MYNDEIFFKVFRNIFLKTLIFSFLKRDRSGHSYNGTTNMLKMLKKNKIEMILDKIKSNHFIYFNYTVFSQIWDHDFEKLFVPFVNKYKNTIKNFTPLEKSITFKSLNHTKYFINMYCFNNNDNNNNNNNNDNNNNIHPSYKIFELFQKSLESGSIETSRYLLQLINENRANFDKDLGSFSSIIDNEGVLKVMNFNPCNFENYFYSLVENLTQEKYDFIKNELKVDLESLIVKNKHLAKVKVRSNGEEPFLINSEMKVPSIDLLLLSNGFNLRILHEVGICVDNIDHAKIYVLRASKKYSSHILPALIHLSNNRDIKKLSTFIQRIEEILNKKMDIIYLLGPFIIYYHLKKGNFQEIEDINTYGTDKNRDFVKKILRQFSVSKFSIAAYIFLKRIEADETFYMFEKESSFDIKINKKVMNHEIALDFFDYIYSKKDFEFITIFLESISQNYSIQFIKTLLDKNNNFKDLLQNSFLLKEQPFYVREKEDSSDLSDSNESNESSESSIDFSDESNIFKDDKVIYERIKRIKIDKLFQNRRYKQVLDLVKEGGRKLGVVPSISFYKLFDKAIPFEWFEKLFTPLIESFFFGNLHRVIEVCCERFDIFEFIWEHYFISIESKKKFIIILLSNSHNTHLFFLLEYIIKEKIDFITNYIYNENKNKNENEKENKEDEYYSQVDSEEEYDEEEEEDDGSYGLYDEEDDGSYLDEDYDEEEEFRYGFEEYQNRKEEYEEIEIPFKGYKIDALFKRTLFDGNIKLLKTLQSAFPSYRFKIDSKEFQQIMENVYIHHKCNVLEYLYENNYITNLVEIIKEINQFKKDENYYLKVNHYGYSASFLLLLQHIIKQQIK
ncbi:hypothetical protein DICPUDRAFT_74205 [Dictyostelium purpureum]|uniref:Uncharacterized protein n=1 Tax=Dictyostelium purpureum TaxID=5786 RepID=F0Z733_DICPU|nr:uncharacterized protein DICPUDRAFT_74205 [Dictyostelium purpureum]EGC40265.1 hypothetical protein DICPUDRAFT_74205 [Dictyostelium purpureum]|eukprot:XP_003283201.1 hypothetical protein DICPUDRAFT_74205 [Dictyostelium purpureum]